MLQSGGTFSGCITLDGTPPLAIPAGASAGSVLTSDALGDASWQPAPGLRTPTAVKTGTSYTASPGDFAKIDSTAGPYTVTLPAAPADKTALGVKLVRSAATVNPVTVTCGGSDSFNVSGGTTLTLKLLNQGVLLQYNAGATAWDVHADDLPLGGLDGRYPQLAAASTYSADQYFKSGRPWFDVIAFGADPTGTADSTSAFNAAILAAVSGNTSPSTTARTAIGPVFIPSGTYKITSDLLIQSVVGFQFIGAGAGTTALRASGTGFTTAVLNIDGSLDGVYGGFVILGDTTEQVPNAVNLTWTTGAARSTSANTLRNIRVRNLKFVTGVSLAGVGTRQLDGTTMQDIVVAGQQTIGSWSATGNWQQGFALGNGSFGNIYDQQMFNCAAGQCYYGWLCKASGFGLFGSQPAGNGCDFNILPGAQVTIENIQSQNAGQLLLGTASSALSPCSMRDVLFKGFATPLTDNRWVHVLGSGGSVDWLLENITNGTAYSSGSPSMAYDFSGSTLKEQVTLINIRQAASPSAGITTASGAGGITAVNYIDTSTTPSTPYPLWLSGAAVNLNAGLTGATQASRWAGATSSGAPASGTFATGDWVIDRSGAIQLCTSGGSPGTWATLATTQSPSVQWVTATGSYTWTKPAGAQTVDVVLLSGGGGGGSGAIQTTGNAGGGGGGGGGALTFRTFAAADLGATVTGTVGAGGAGGTAVSGTTATSGNAGSAGASTTFGSLAIAVLAGAGGAGTTAGGAAGAGGVGISAGAPGGAGGATGAGVGTNPAGGATGGGGGASTSVTANGGTSQYSYCGSASNVAAGGIAGGAAPGTGTQPAVRGTPSCGAGGGASVNTAGSAAQTGGAAFYGGGGGGGGAAFYPGSGSAVTSGAGGAGGPGFALIITHFA
jgi:hypothetical protein